MIDNESGERRSVVLEVWRRFWFAPEPAYPLGLVRIAFGALTVAWTVSLLPDLNSLFGDQGVMPNQLTAEYVWGLFGIASSDHALLIGWVVLLVSAVALTLGWHSRLAALAVFVLIHSFQQRSPFVFNSGDGLMRVVALVLILSSCGAALSLDRRRASGSFWSAELRAPWAIRMLQVQLSLVYLSTVNAKLAGDSWREGTAVSYALRYDDMLIVSPPHWLTSNALLMNVATWGTLALEVAIGILVWVKPLRRWVLRRRTAHAFDDHGDHRCRLLHASDVRPVPGIRPARHRATATRNDPAAHRGRAISRSASTPSRRPRAARADRTDRRHHRRGCPLTAVAQRPLSTVDAPAEPRLRGQWEWILAAAIPTALTGLHAAFYGQWIVDDAGLSFAYARSLATGAGPVLQAGSVPVEGFSNPTWVAVLAVGRALHLFDHGSWFGIPDVVLVSEAGRTAVLLRDVRPHVLDRTHRVATTRRDHPRRGHSHCGGAVVRHLDHERFGERTLRAHRHGDRRRPRARGGVRSAARP